MNKEVQDLHLHQKASSCTKTQPETGVLVQSPLKPNPHSSPRAAFEILGARHSSHLEAGRQIA
jgi:hypothetical protein